MYTILYCFLYIYLNFIFKLWKVQVDCCKKKCKENLLQKDILNLNEIMKLRTQYQNKNEKEKRQFVLNYVTHSRQTFKTTLYHHKGHMMCKQAWMDLHGISDRKLRGAMNTYKSGGLIAAVHGNTARISRKEETIKALGCTLQVLEQHSQCSGEKV